jgi:hypothetical protein
MARRHAEQWLGRILTGPAAFFVAGFIDLTIYAWAAIRQRGRHEPPSASSTIGGR